MLSEYTYFFPPSPSSYPNGKPVQGTLAVTVAFVRHNTSSRFMLTQTKEVRFYCPCTFMKELTLQVDSLCL